MIPFETIDMTRYQAAIQHPKTAFADLELRGMRVHKNSLGWPAAQTGNFAIVYRLIGRRRVTTDRLSPGEEVVAVRCFKKLAPDLAKRYELICAALDTAAPASKFLLRTRYLPEGIKIDGGWKPVTTLPWVDAVSLDRHFDQAHTKAHEMHRLRGQIRDMARDLESAGIAHCDLQHRNVLVDQAGTLRLIDYDGMYVPALKGMHTNELGHPDFQHPGRDDGAIFGPGLDRFSLISIYLQTYAVAQHPELWVAKERTEGLLLRREDYLDPDASATIAALRAHDDLRPSVDWFRRMCVEPLENVPPLATFIREMELDGRARPQPTQPPRASDSAAVDSPPTSFAVAPPRSGPTLFMSVIPTEELQLTANAGDEVMVVGQFESSRRGQDSMGESATSLYFRVSGNATFSVLVEGATSRQFATLGPNWTVRPGSWLAATGLLVRAGRDFVIQIDQIAQLERIDAKEAVRRLNQLQSPTPTAAKVSRNARPSGASEPKAAIVRAPSTPPLGQPEARGGNHVLRDFRELGKLFGRDGRDRK